MATVNATPWDDRYFSAVGVVVIGCPVAWFLYAIVPLGALKGFAKHDQIGFGEQALDTKGIAFDQVRG